MIEGRTSPGLFPFLDRFDGFPTTICADRRLAMSPGRAVRARSVEITRTFSRRDSAWIPFSS
ncbi:hypothetical protein HMPREF1979_01813 [Actinomyces johnsonii F0542]|uniref:Uncharacterized protein n=1 Tax=Actinomyces johnsonii F0542 TaxID=1321818 RepID=U1QP05_9ACTO|nr:hypothetical protein HMPREF1979_01813 [Actinomyces johnsonii F0542]